MKRAAKRDRLSGHYIVLTTSVRERSKLNLGKQNIPRGDDMKRLVILSVLMGLCMLWQNAFAGEWNPARGEVAAKTNGNSDCLFNGRDETDAAFGGGEPNGPTGPDDPLWSSTPAGAHGSGRVQSYGQMVAFGLKAVIPSPGVACNGHLNPLR